MSGSKQIRAIHSIMCGQSATILDLVTREVLEQLVSICNRILNNSDYMRNLYCLTIYSLVAKGTSTTPATMSIGSSEGAQPSEAVKEWCKVTRKFLAGDRASKITSLTVVRVLHLCSEDRGSSSIEALEGLVLCTRIIDAIDTTVAVQWPLERERENQLILKKLEGRLFSEKTERVVKNCDGAPVTMLTVAIFKLTVAKTSFC